MMNSDENMGDILIQVQEEVHQLREKVHAGNSSSDKPITIEELDQALAKTEQELQYKTAQFAFQLNNKVKTIPSVVYEEESKNEVYSAEYGSGDAESPYQVEQQQIFQQSQKPWYTALNSLGESLLPQRHAARPSPGQQFKHRVALKSVVNPQNEKNRNVLHDSYGIQLPLISQKKQAKVLSESNKKIIIGSTVDRLAALPKANRMDPLLTPPPISERDAQKGLLSLLQRGLIPPSAEITLEPPPVELKAIQYSEGIQKPKKKVIPTVLDISGNLVPVKNGVSATEESQKQKKSIAATRAPRQELLPTTIVGPIKMKKISESLKQQTPITSPPSPKQVVTERPVSDMLPFPPPTTPQIPFTEMYKLAIQDGKTRRDTNEFTDFKQTNHNDWGRISTMLEHLESLLADHSVPFAFVNSNKLIELIKVMDIERVPDIQDLISVFINAKEIQETIHRKGQKYKGVRGKSFAATTIQTNWRRLRERRKFLEYRKMKWASGVFAIGWIMRMRAVKNRMRLQETRADNLETFRRKMKTFKSSWKRIKNSRRVVVHIPSLGYSENTRADMFNFHVEQNNQIARICSVLDPNVDVIYVSPIAVTDEAKQYYQKLLSLKSAIDSGDVKNAADMSTRITFIVPEVIPQFSKKNLCLSSMLKYSPNAQKRIQRLIKGRDAYIVPGMISIDDLEIVRILDIPIMGTEPQVAHLFSTKSGGKRIFENAGVDIPPGEYDIYSVDQLIETVSQLVINNLNVKRWLFKCNKSVSGNGIAYCDISGHLSCYTHILKERARYGKEWCHRWAHEASFHQVISEIPKLLCQHAQILNTSLYPTWDDFKIAFLNEGGIIEAYPPAESVTVLQADLMIEPDGNTRLLSIGDQISGSSVFKPWGISVPQSSIDTGRINTVCQKVAASCQSRNIIGYFTLAMVTFINEETLEQMLWCIDISLSYSDNLAMFELFTFMTNCTLDTESHQLTITEIKAPAPTDTKPERFTTIKKKEFVPYRFGVLSTKLYHSNLSIIHYSVFFQMCRAHGIGYDIKEKQGSVFMLIDYTYRDHLGMIVISDQLPNCLAAFGRNLNILHQEVSSPNMQGDTNFKEAMNSIKEILGVTSLNAQEDEEESSCECLDDSTSK